jgi:hypothetical protein
MALKSLTHTNEWQTSVKFQSSLQQKLNGRKPYSNASLREVVGVWGGFPEALNGSGRVAGRLNCLLIHGRSGRQRTNKPQVTTCRLGLLQNAQ